MWLLSDSLPRLDVSVCGFHCQTILAAQECSQAEAALRPNTTTRLDACGGIASQCRRVDMNNNTEPRNGMPSPRLSESELERRGDTKSLRSAAERCNQGGARASADPALNEQERRAPNCVREPGVRGRVWAGLPSNATPSTSVEGSVSEWSGGCFCFRLRRRYPRMR
jgi:hypothetical protein